jgi:hypothetical protein
MPRACLALMIVSACSFQQRAIQLAPLTDGGSAAAPTSSGADAVAQRHCASCHDPGDGTFSGQAAAQPGSLTHAPNLTPDPATGLGSWSDAQVVRALRTGVDDEMALLCPTMPRFSDMADAEATAIVAFLRGLRPVSNKVPDSICPPLKPGDDARGSDLGVVAGGCAPVINELQTAGPTGAADEFIELYNPCPDSYALDGHRLVYRSAAGNVDVTLATFSGRTLGSHEYLVVAGTGYGGAATLRYSGGLASAGGGVALRASGGGLIDAVAYGSATNAFVRGTAAATAASGHSIARHPDGLAACQDAATDFSAGMPTPGASNG